MPGDDPETGKPPDLRASDADRDRVVDVLRAALEDGRLTADEFDERVGAALSSRTLRELARLTADLVPGQDALGARGGPGGVGGAGGLAGAGGLGGPGTGYRGAGSAQAEDVIRIDQRGGSVQRTGRWVVPRRLELRSSWCDVTLDFTEAVISHDTLPIDMNMRGGSLTLVAGPGIVVDAVALATRYVDVDIRPGTEPGAPVILRVQLAGRMRYGRIEAR